MIESPMLKLLGSRISVLGANLDHSIIWRSYNALAS